MCIALLHVIIGSQGGGLDLFKIVRVASHYRPQLDKSMSKTNWRERHGPDRELNERDLEILAYFTARQNLGKPAKRIGTQQFAMAVIREVLGGETVLEVGTKVSHSVLLRQYNAARRRLINRINAQPMFMGRPLPMPLSYRLDEIPKRGRPKKTRA